MSADLNRYKLLAVEVIIGDVYYTVESHARRHPQRGGLRVVQTKWRRKKESIGAGTFGVVRLEEKETSENDDAKVFGETRAIKVMMKDTLAAIGVDYKREIEALTEFSARQYSPAEIFVEFIGWYENYQHLYLVMEYIPLGDLEKHIPPEGLSEDATWQITQDLLYGLKFMHEAGFAHRDLKPQNIFVTQKPPAVESWAIKIGDFGISKRVANQQTQFRTRVGTPHYQAPEIVDDDRETSAYSYAADLWSLGCVVVKIATGKTPFDGPRDVRNYCANTSILAAESLLREKLGPEGIAFVKGLLSPKPRDRPSADVALSNEWITTMRTEPSEERSLAVPHSTMSQAEERALPLTDAVINHDLYGPVSDDHDNPALSHEPIVSPTGRPLFYSWKEDVPLQIKLGNEDHYFINCFFVPKSTNLLVQDESNMWFKIETEHRGPAVAIRDPRRTSGGLTNNGVRRSAIAYISCPGEYIAIGGSLDHKACIIILDRELSVKWQTTLTDWTATDYISCCNSAPYLAASSMTGEVKIWNISRLASEELTSSTPSWTRTSRTLHHCPIILLRDEHHALVTDGVDIIIWSLNNSSGTSNTVLGSHRRRISEMVLSHDGSRLVSTSFLGGETKVWNVTTRTLLFNLSYGTAHSRVVSPVFAPHQPMLVTLVKDYLAPEKVTSLVVWNLQENKGDRPAASDEIYRSPLHNVLAFWPDETTVAVLHAEGGVRQVVRFWRRKLITNEDYRAELPDARLSGKKNNTPSAIEQQSLSPWEELGPSADEPGFSCRPETSQETVRPTPHSRSETPVIYDAVNTKPLGPVAVRQDAMAGVARTPNRELRSVATDDMSTYRASPQHDNSRLSRSETSVLGAQKHALTIVWVDRNQPIPIYCPEPVVFKHMIMNADCVALGLSQSNEFYIINEKRHCEKIVTTIDNFLPWTGTDTRPPAMAASWNHRYMAPIFKYALGGSIAGHGAVLLYNTSVNGKRRPFYTVKIHDWQAVASVAFDEQNSFAACSDTGDVRVWDIATGENPITLGDEHLVANYRSASRIGSVVVLSKQKEWCDKDWWFIIRSDDKDILLSYFRRNPYKNIPNPENPIQLTIGAHSTTIRNMVISTHGKYLATISEDQIIKVWHVYDRTLVVIPQIGGSLTRTISMTINEQHMVLVTVTDLSVYNASPTDPSRRQLFLCNLEGRLGRTAVAILLGAKKSGFLAVSFTRPTEETCEMYAMISASHERPPLALHVWGKDETSALGRGLRRAYDSLSLRKK